MSDKYLMIRNPGVAPLECFTMMGVSTTRFAGHSDTIGCFGTGSKMGTMVLLRNDIKPTIFCGNVKMKFDTEPLPVNDGLTEHTFNQITVTYSGQEIVMEDGVPSLKTYKRTDKLDYTAEMGTYDWTDVAMGLREFVANALDRTMRENGDITEAEIEIYEGKPRAKKGTTAVFVPLTYEVEHFYKTLKKRFLHFTDQDLKVKILDKTMRNIEDGSKSAVIYKHGVYVRESGSKLSLFDYNFGDELRLNDARTIDDWDVRTAVARGIRDASFDKLVVIFRALLNGEDTYETTCLDGYYLNNDSNTTLGAERSANWKRAWELVAGENGVMTSGIAGLESFITAKGYAAKTIARKEWFAAMQTYGIRSESQVLNKSEKAGRVLSTATDDMIAVRDSVWALLERFNLLSGRQKPDVVGFTTVMDGGSEKKGESDYDEGVVYIHTDHATGQSHYLKQLMLEEIVHHVTGSADFSRDIQDFLFRLVVNGLL